MLCCFDCVISYWESCLLEIVCFLFMYVLVFYSLIITLNIKIEITFNICEMAAGNEEDDCDKANMNVREERKILLNG